MKSAWKWVLGILIVLIIVVFLFGIGWRMWNFHNFNLGAREFRDLPGGGQWVMPHQDFRSFRMPGTMMVRMSPFTGLLGGLLPLGFLVLVVLGIIWLVRSLSSHPRVEPGVTVQAAPAEVLPTQSAAEADHACKRCGSHLEVSWKVCPHCGKKI
jgi:hypothetical protein